MRRPLALGLALLWTWALPAQAQQIDRYVETVIVNGSGNGQVRVAIDLPAGWSTPLRLPIVASRPTDLSIDGGADETASIESREGQTWIALVPGAPAPAATTLVVSYRNEAVVDMAGAPLAHGVRRVRSAFVNTTGAAVNGFERTVVLPAGFVVASVDEVVPAPTESTVGQAYELRARDGRTSVTVRAKTLASGGTAGATIRFKPRASPLPLLGVLALVAAAYLYRFRDLITRTAPAAPHPAA